MALTVTEQGKDPIEVPQHVVAEGAEAIESYVNRIREPDKPLSKMSRSELDDRAREVGLDPEKYSNMGDLREAIEGASKED